MFSDIPIKWRDVYILPRLVTINSTLRMFHYKVFNNVLCLNKQVFRFGLITSKLCSFCNQVDKTVIRIFAECSATKKIWKKLINYFRNTLDLPEISLQSAIFGFLHSDKKTFQIKNLILLFFQIYLYESRSSKALDFDCFLKEILKTSVLEKNVPLTMKQNKNI